VALNRDRGRDEVYLYEIAPVFLARIGEKDSQPDEPLHLAAVATAGTTAESSAVAFYRLKSVLDGCIAELSAPACTYQRGAAELFHPGRCAAVTLEGRQLGYLGELHPTVAASLKLEGRVVAFEIDVEPVLAASHLPKAQPLPRFPAVERDLALVVEEHVAAGTLLASITEAGGDLLETARAFDEYHGAQVPEGNKSIAFTLTFRSPERTLTDAEVEKVMAEIKQTLEKRHQARFRT
jgi:phenylalanyl-tRNA synthetase beta chain